MAPKYKLHYFNVPALGEPIRFLFLYGNLPFEDETLDRNDWPNLKNKYYFEKLPVLEEDGKMANQSVAIGRYVAKKVGLYGGDDWEALQIDGLIDTLNDMRQTFTDIFRTKDEEQKAAKKKEAETVTLPFYLNKFEEIVKKNEGHFVNGKLSWADVYFAAQYDLFQKFISENCFDKHPALLGLVTKIRNMPRIKEYLAKRTSSF